MRGRLVGAFVAGCIVGAAAVWGLVARHGLQVEVLEGSAFTDRSGSSVVIGGEAFSFSPSWQYRDSWHDDQPEGCLPNAGDQGPDSAPARLGFIRVPPTDDVGGRDVVVWIQCLEDA